MYELCPYGSLAFLECIEALSKICYRHKPDVSAGKEGSWKTFKNDFMFKFLEMPALARSDCFGPDFDIFLKRRKGEWFMLSADDLEFLINVCGFNYFVEGFKPDSSRDDIEAVYRRRP
jgi:hypothetical protein